jgi:hypothetical protein
MKRERYIHAALYLTFHLLFVVSLPHCRSFLCSGLGRTIGTLLFATVLMFTIVRSADLYRTISTCLLALPLSWVAPVFDCGFASIPSFDLLVASEPALSPIAQRPPPIFS